MAIARGATSSRQQAIKRVYGGVFARGQRQKNRKPPAARNAQLTEAGEPDLRKN